jgi:Beta-lactamase class C and other penicillin binding proteins
MTYLRAFTAFLLAVCSMEFSGTSTTCAQQRNQKLHRLDGSTISTAEAEAFARRTLEEQRVTGAQVAVINGGKLVWSAAFGLRGRDPDLPMDRETTMWAASITKSVFATYVMMLVERGQFQLDVPVEKPLQGYEGYKETGSAIVSEADWPLVTPHMLLSHTSGLLNFALPLSAGPEDASAFQAGSKVQLLGRRNQSRAVADRAAKVQADRSADARSAFYSAKNDSDWIDLPPGVCTWPIGSTSMKHFAPRRAAFLPARPVR